MLCISETLIQLLIFTKDDKPFSPAYDVYGILVCTFMLLNSTEGQIIRWKYTVARSILTHVLRKRLRFHSVSVHVSERKLM
jgi:hypothetical protein